MRIIIDADRGSRGLDVNELYQYRDLFLMLSWRDLRVRYAQTFLGLTWAFIQPLATLLIFTLIFGRALNVPTGEIPYPVYALTGLLAWSYFAYVLNQSGQSIIGAQEMVKKVYFPRIIIPLSKIITGFVDFLVTLLFLVAVMIYYKVSVSSFAVYLPAFIILNVLAALGIGVWVASLTIRYRDFQHILPFFVQIGLYATPVAYPASLIPSNYQLVYYLNPMAGIVEGYHWALLGSSFPGEYAWISYAMTVIVFISGFVYFNKVERTMADFV